MIRSYAELPLAKKLQWVSMLVGLLKTDEEIKEILAQYGHTDEKTEEFEELFKKANDSITNQNTTNSEKKESYVKYSESFADLEKDYLKAFSFAELAFKKSPEKAVALQLHLSKPTKQSDLLKRIYTFLEIMLKDNEILEKMGKYLYTKEKVLAIKDKLKKTNELYMSATEESREYHSLVEAKNMAFIKMEQSLEDLINLLRIVFADRPDILKKLDV